MSVDGVTFTRSESDAAERGVERRAHFGWDELSGAEVQTTGKGRPVIRVRVHGGPTPQHHRSDPFALRLPRKHAEAARRLVEQIEDEVAARRQWARNRSKDGDHDCLTS